MHGFNLLPARAELPLRTTLTWALLAALLGWGAGEWGLRPMREALAATAAEHRQLASQVKQAQERRGPSEEPLDHAAQLEASAARSLSQGLLRVLLALEPSAGKLEQLRLADRHFTVRGRMPAADLPGWMAASTPSGMPAAELLELSEPEGDADPVGFRFSLRWRLIEAASARP